MKFVIVIALLAVLAALAGAGLFMLNKRPSDDGNAADKRMAWALAVRVGMSVALFLLLLLAWKLGWISPKGLPTGR